VLALGIIGSGAVVRERHLPALARVPEIDVVAIADVDAARAHAVAAEWSVPHAYGDAEELLAHAGVDAVAICTPPRAHAVLAVAALEAGKAVLVEKPLALSLDDADRIVDAARAAGTVAAVGFNLRGHRLVRRARALVRRGELGAVAAVRTVFSDPLLARPDLPAWRTSPADGGGGFFDRLVHHFDLWRFLLDDEVEQVAALAEPGDHAVVVGGRMRSGALVSSIGLDRSVLAHAVTLYGARGGLELDLYRFDGLVRTDLAELPGSPRARVRRLGETLAEAWTARDAIRRGGDFLGSYDEQWRAFAAGRPLATLDDGRRALEIAVTAARAAEPQPVA